MFSATLSFRVGSGLRYLLHLTSQGVCVCVCAGVKVCRCVGPVRPSFSHLELTDRLAFFRPKRKWIPHRGLERYLAHISVNDRPVSSSLRPTAGHSRTAAKRERGKKNKVPALWFPGRRRCISAVRTHTPRLIPYRVMYKRKRSQLSHATEFTPPPFFLLFALGFPQFFGLEAPRGRHG